MPLMPLDTGWVWDRLLTHLVRPKVARAGMAVGFGVIAAVTLFS
jgi:hypothetical protein